MPQSDTKADCPVCRANSGEKRISPADPIHVGEYWAVEHAYPTSLLGWVVIVLKRHAEALHDLTKEEGQELGILQWAVARALQDETGCLKQYSICFGEKTQFSHLHFHMVPRRRDLERNLRGGRVFSFLNPAAEDVVAADVVSEFCENAAARVKRLLEPEE